MGHITEAKMQIRIRQYSRIKTKKLFATPPEV